MSIHLVVTVMAADKPGIVEQIAQTISDAGASWLESRMTRLAGEFAGIIEVSAPEAVADALSKSIEALGPGRPLVQIIEALNRRIKHTQNKEEEL